MRIALDIEGGDYAPVEILKGAYLADSELPGVELILLGNETIIRQSIKKNYSGFNPVIINVTENIEMDESPARAIRRKRHSSIVKGVSLVKDGKADAFVSCGNTGAMVSGAILGLRLIPGVERPGIALVVPTLKGNCLIMDVGANIDPKPKHLMQYGLMTDIYSRKVLNKQNPSIGLLNIGKEESKGPGFLKETAVLLKKTLPNFIGNIEPKEIFAGECDCVICDGLVGNIVLKLSEGVSDLFKHFLFTEIKKSFLGMLGFSLIKGSFYEFGRRMDYSEYGGAPLLGVNGVIIIGHGSSNAKAVKNAVKVACKEIDRNINKSIEERIDSVEKTFFS
jgi:phosphate acyltransferase